MTRLSAELIYLKECLINYFVIGNTDCDKGTYTIPHPRIT